MCSWLPPGIKFTSRCICCSKAEETSSCREAGQDDTIGSLTDEVYGLTDNIGEEKPDELRFNVPSSWPYILDLCASLRQSASANLGVSITLHQGGVSLNLRSSAGDGRGLGFSLYLLGRAIIMNGVVNHSPSR